MLWWGGLLFLFLFFMMSAVFKVWILEWSLFSFSGKELNCVFIWDTFTFVFMSVVIFISCMIFFYSFYYMDTEKSRLGFISLLFLFVLSMLCLISSSNLAFLLLGWDGLGLTSYILVVYYSSGSSSIAGMLTFLINRLGDVFFLFSISYMVFFFDWEASGVNKNLTGLATLLMVAFMTKSAQIPFSSWLPAAMAAPTPVSSLVHSSTLVTAGVFLFIRFKNIFTMFTFILLSMSILTLLLAGIMANYEWDLKKLIAFSTLSQLGFMLVSYSLGFVVLSFFHLITHALFKASLFMCAGALIHSGDNSQEFRNSFSIMVKPFISGAILICLFCLSGIPFTSGFFSKDMILDGSLGSYVIFFFFLVGVALTISYSFRFFVYSMKYFFSFRSGLLMVYENSSFLIFPIWFLVFFALSGGFVLSEVGFVSSMLLWASSGWKVFYVLYIISTAYLFSCLSKKMSSISFKKFFFSTMWFLNKIISSKLGALSSSVSKNIYKKIDGGWLEEIGPQALFGLNSMVGLKIFFMQSFVVVSFFYLFIFLFFSL